MSVQVSALALMIRDTMTGVEFEPSSDAHATHSGLERQQIIAFHRRTSFGQTGASAWSLSQDQIIDVMLPA